MLIVVYVISAFGWLTYSLIDFTDEEYRLKIKILEAGREATMLNVIEKAKSGDLNGPESRIYYLRQLELELDSSALNKFLKQEFFGSFVANYTFKDTAAFLGIDVSPIQLRQIKNERRNNSRLYIIQAFVLTLLVGAGVYGVYYSVRFMYNLNKQQNNFLLSVTHEFKTPIAAIKLMLQTIQSRNLDKDKAMTLIEKSIENANRLNELTENVLTAMQIENNKYRYGREHFSLSDLISNLVNENKLNGLIRAEIEAGIFFEGDPFILKITFGNLIENAFKYSNGEEIIVSLEKNETEIVVSVADFGPGIPEKFKYKVFRKFYRIEDEETRSTKGTGLGLYIAKQAVLKHKGNIEILSNVPKGSIFKVTFSLKK